MLLAVDTETTTINKGNPYHPLNKLVSIGIFNGNEYIEYYKNFPTEEIQKILDGQELIFFNGKFDLAWLRNIGINTDNFIVRDCQLSEFLITNQQKAYPSLNECGLKYLNETKIDIIKDTYWDNGIDTWFIPQKVLSEYLEQDCRLTYNVYLKQLEILKKENKYNLFKLQCADTIELHLMEYNGILYEKEESIRKGNELEYEINKLIERIKNYITCPSFNFNSGDHLSCLLYGGTITHTDRICVGDYKSGQKIGQPRYKLFTTEYKQERLVEPLKGSELKKDGYWSTDEPTLKSLKAKGKIKELINNLLEISKLEKLRGTYYLGIPKLIEKHEWKDNYIHGQFIQTVARTGRLSSVEPNLQNFDPKIKQLCISRYD